MEEFLTRFSIHSNNEWLVGAVDSSIILIFYFLFLLFHRSIVQGLLKRVAAKFNLNAEDSLLISFDSFLKRFLLFYALSLALENFPLPVKTQAVLQDVIYLMVAVLCTALAFDIINILGTQLGRWGAKEFKPLFGKISKGLAASVCLMVVMRHFNYDIWHIVTALGIGSLAIGLAAQPTLTNMIAGFTLLIDRPFMPGDHIFSPAETKETCSL